MPSIDAITGGDERTARIFRSILVPLTCAALAVSLPACGGGEPAEEAEGPAVEEPTEEAAEAEPGALTVPEWMTVDSDAGSVTMTVTAGTTSENNYWNYEGYFDGDAEIVVPQGSTVEIEFRNADPNMAHSLGIGEYQENWPANFRDPVPVFEGALTSGATMLADATQPGESETISFTASEPGEYAMVCYLPGHAVAGMWIYFTVSAEGDFGLSSSS